MVLALVRPMVLSQQLALLTNQMCPHKWLAFSECRTFPTRARHVLHLAVHVCHSDLQRNGRMGRAERDRVQVTAGWIRAAFFCRPQVSMQGLRKTIRHATGLNFFMPFHVGYDCGQDAISVHARHHSVGRRVKLVDAKGTKTDDRATLWPHTNSTHVRAH